MIFDHYGDLPIQREPLPPPQQARYADGVLVIDDSVPDHGLEAVLTQVRHKLIGNDHLAPNCHPWRPRHLSLVEDHDPDEHGAGDRDEDSDRGVG